MLQNRKILAVDDDTDLLNVIETLFEREKMSVIRAGTLAEMWRHLDSGDLDLVLLDVMLPDGDGMEAVRDLRQKSNLPIIMLTGRDAAVDRVLGLEFGADDYIGKPFEPRELLARVRSVLRRYRTDEAPSASQKLEFGDFQLCRATRTLTHSDKGEVELTSTEFELLRCLAEAANRPLNRDQLMDGAFSRDWSPFDRSIDVMIGRLRKKVESDPAAPRLIKTVRGVGYVLTAAQPESEAQRTAANS
ncbi:MAG: response regulator [Pseudomonadota bacterium]